ncbi:MAG: M23 family metallopeptidase [Alphaproteobacteria bacterium]|nr:M23 family metallopeptidase [Alphaproteobacteria bacterium]
MNSIFKRNLLIICMLFFLTACGVSSADYLASLPPRSYTVRTNETVYTLSRKYKVPIRTIIEANDLKPPYILQKGQVLKIPRAQIHTVKSGETLYGIARMYGVDFTTLAKQNKIKEPWTLSVGQNLYLPATLNKNMTDFPSDTDTPPAQQVAQKQETTTAQPAKTADKKQQKKVAAAKVSLPDVPKRSGKFEWPVKGSIISGYGVSGNGRRNDGINISAKKGTPIKAAENGVVAYSGNELKGFGNLVLIKHSDGWITAYAHADKISVKKGMTVKKGQVIGEVGNTGNVKTPQLHFEVRKGTKASNPINYLKN